MDQELVEKSYAHCKQLCKNASTTFFSSFSALEYEKRCAVHAVYAFCRWIDDIVDGDTEPLVEESQELLQATLERDIIIKNIHIDKQPANSEKKYISKLMALVSIRNNLQRASEGKIRSDESLVFVALQDVFSRYPIRLHDFETLIEGMEDDLFIVQYDTWDDLRAYCYKVASAVGLILIEIYGYEDRAARLHAIDFGIQMQLINVLRDVNEDYENGRIYLPVEVLASHNLKPSDLANQELAKNTSWKAFISEYFEIVGTHQNSAMHLFDYLDPRSRVQPKLMSDAYSQILYQIIRSSGDVFTSPLKLTFFSKISLWVKINYLKIKAKLALGTT